MRQTPFLSPRRKCLKLFSNVTLRYNEITEWRGSSQSSLPLHSYIPCMERMEEN
jgi:hypothetical protein